MANWLGQKLGRTSQSPRAERPAHPAPPDAPLWTLRLDVQARDWPVEMVGGKAEGLRRLWEAGFEVPRAFCVTTDAFEAVVGALVHEATSLQDLQEALRHAPLPEPLYLAIAAQMAELGAPLWAVRSSAVEEDRQGHSFAGQQTSVLEVRGVEDVVAALREVWASLYDVEGLLYRTRLNVNLVPRAMAVVIQEMVAPEVAGVMFTANPLSRDEQEVVINSAPGLGHKVVSGGAADTYYVEKASGYVRHFQEAGEPCHGPDGRSGQGSLRADQLEELARVARGVEAYFGQPQDIEWAFARPLSALPDAPLGLYLLQARPITGEAGADGGATGPSVWTNANVGEALPGVATPLTWSIIHKFSRKGFEQAFRTMGLSVPDKYELVGSFRGRIYLNLTEFMSVASAIPVFKPETLLAMAGGGGAELVRDIYERRDAGEFWRHLPATFSKVVSAQLSMPVVGPLWARYFNAKRDEFFEQNLEALDHLELLAQLEVIDSLFDRTGLVMLTCSSNFLLTYVITRELFHMVGGPEAGAHEQELFAGLQVKSAEPGFALLEMGRMTRRSRRLRRIISSTPAAQTLEALEAEREHEDVAAFLRALEQFRRDWGHRAPREAELATPRWREESAFLFEVVRSFIQAPHLPSVLEVERERERARQSVRAIVRSSFPPGLRGLFALILAYTQYNARQREFMRDRVVDTLAIYRRFFLELGRRLAEQGRLRQAEDVFFLTYPELRQWLLTGADIQSFGLHVLVRRAIYEAFRKLPDPPNTFLLRGSELIAEEDLLQHGQHGPQVVDGPDATYLEIVGLPGSSGRATGYARVIHDPTLEDATLQPGEILVAPYTDVGWTPLFLTASAVVTSLGGPLSHSCIVAREYGIPTVVNARRATDLIRTGDLVTVDGDRGVVYVRTAPQDRLTPMTTPETTLSASSASGVTGGPIRG